MARRVRSFGSADQRGRPALSRAYIERGGETPRSGEQVVGKFGVGMKCCTAGDGAIGKQHLAGLGSIDAVEGFRSSEALLNRPQRGHLHDFFFEPVATVSPGP